MRDVLNKVNYVTRWFLLIGVMTGICFSSGEGIQLLPFPASPEQTEKNTIPQQDEKFKAYTLSVLSSAIHTSAVKSKVQKDLKQPACADIIGCRIEFINHHFQPSARVDFAVRFFPTSIFPATPSSRAPPAI